MEKIDKEAGRHMQKETKNRKKKKNNEIALENQVKTAIEQRKKYGTDRGTEGWDNRKRLLCL